MSLEERLAAVERALTESETPPAALADAAELDDRLTAVEERLDALETALADLDAGLQAVRGYAGSIRATNREVERRADAALATAEELERRLADDARTRRPVDDAPTRRPVDDAPVMRADGKHTETAHPPEPDRTFEPPEPEEEEPGPLSRLRDAL
ncbi:DUF7310 family coiled-coil domain-containing protein [Natronomonas sp. EA1]|uniref:DUF7310 family coiled-coil domain-containing protein n=1 Tax=Natronomonas sp. EA1 TaxID=3421655 RepID=UPI003EC146B2